MCNSIFLNDKNLPRADDGDEATVTVKGIYHTDENGIRKLDVLEVDGKEVNDPEECGCGGDHGGEAMDAHDALEVFLITNKKKK